VQIRAIAFEKNRLTSVHFISEKNNFTVPNATVYTLITGKG